VRIQVSGQEAFVGTGSRPLAANGGDAVVFIHGAGMDHTVWALPARYFARHDYRVIAPDLPGHGLSSGSPLTTIDAMSAWLNELLAAVGVSRATLVGHSMGALVVWALALRRPAMARGLVLIGPALPMRVSQGLLDAAADDDHAALEMANTWSHSARGRLGGKGMPGIFEFGAGERLLERARRGVFHADLSACNGFDPDGRPPAGIPVTVVVGTEDRMTPAAAGRAVAGLVGEAGTVRTLAGAGHSMMAECPNELLDVLIEAVRP
jgi:pimeloyl-ACP methyl ester carboxylesterase